MAEFTSERREEKTPSCGTKSGFANLPSKSPANRATWRWAANEANRALLNYLGNPVAPPAGMDSRYDKENLLKAFTTLCQIPGLIITKLAVDDSEFPFIVYGTLWMGTTNCRTRRLLNYRKVILMAAR